EVQTFRHLRTNRVILIRRNRDRGQDADDGHHDHQLDEREAALLLLKHVNSLAVSVLKSKATPTRLAAHCNRHATASLEQRKRGNFSGLQRQRALKSSLAAT